MTKYHYLNLMFFFFFFQINSDIFADLSFKLQ